MSIETLPASSAEITQTEESNHAKKLPLLVRPIAMNSRMVLINPHEHNYQKQAIVVDPLTSKRSKSEPQLESLGTTLKAKRTISEPIRKLSTTTSHPHELVKLLSQDLHYIKDASQNFSKYETNVADRLSDAFNKLNTLEVALHDPNPTRELKQHIPSKSKVNSTDLDPHWYLHSKNVNLSHSAVIRNFEVQYEGLRTELKNCLQCFSVFPENAIVSKRLMIYWWMAEGFTSRRSQERAEDLGAEFFNELIEKKFIQPVNRKNSTDFGSCKMDPFVHAAVVKLAERTRFFEYNTKLEGEDDHTSLRAFQEGMSLLFKAEDLDKLHMLFNFSEDILDFKPEWFIKMKNVKLLYLGRWQHSADHHIEVEDPKILEGLKHMKRLKFLSLRGISRISELPRSISKLRKLEILDLRACHNLEVVPDDIGELKSLTHLDMSECYLLDSMPKKLSLLKNLVVLKGFLVADAKDNTSCTLEDLTKLSNLQKLSIYTGRKDFPTEKDLIALREFKGLCKLRITWGGKSMGVGSKAYHQRDGKKQIDMGELDEGEVNKKMNDTRTKPPLQPLAVNKGLPRLMTRMQTMIGKDNKISAALPEKLEKLELQCFPSTKSPIWLKPGNLQSLKKLYIKGGKLRYLGQRCVAHGEDTWKVETLRLKYLSELEMDWRELCNLFPELVYLEKVKCRKLTLFPCNEVGVWMKKTKFLPVA